MGSSPSTRSRSSEGLCEVEAAEECATFELPPYFLDLPLDEVRVDVGAASVAEGTTACPDWPEQASLRVTGSFDADDGSDPVPFVVYFHAEVKVEMAFETPLALEGDKRGGRRRRNRRAGVVRAERRHGGGLIPAPAFLYGGRYPAALTDSHPGSRLPKIS